MEYCDTELGCQDGTPVVCDDQDVCTEDYCDEDLDQCVYDYIYREISLPDKVIGDPKTECL